MKASELPAGDAFARGTIGIVVALDVSGSMVSSKYIDMQIITSLSLVPNLLNYSDTFTYFHIISPLFIACRKA